MLNFSSILCLILITLKLTNYIDWSWLAVFSPLWLAWLFQFVAISLVYFIKRGPL